MQLVTVCSVKPLAQSTRKRGAPLDLTADPAIPRPAVSPSNSHSYIGVASPALMPRPNFARRRGKSRSSAHLFGFSVWSSRSAAALRYPASLTVRPLPFHCASLLRSAATPVAALATVLLAHVSAFDRFDEIFISSKTHPISPSRTLSVATSLWQYAPTITRALAAWQRVPCLHGRPRPSHHSALAFGYLSTVPLA